VWFGLLPGQGRSTSCLNSSLGIELPCAPRVPQSNLCPSLRATYQLPRLVHPSTLVPVSRSVVDAVAQHQVIGFSPRFRKALLKKFIERFQFSSLQYCPARTSHRYCPTPTNRASFSCSLVFSPSQEISFDLAQDEDCPPTIQFRCHGSLLPESGAVLSPPKSAGFLSSAILALSMVVSLPPPLCHNPGENYSRHLRAQNIQDIM